MVLIGLVPAVGLVAVTGIQQRQRAAEQVKAEAIGLARLASADQARLIEQAHQVLVALAQIPAIKQGDQAACTDLLRDVRRQYPFTANLGVIRLDGSVACSALPFDPSLDLSDRLYFQRALETRDFSIGEYQVGRITGVPSINFGYPIRGEDGYITGVAFAALDLAWLSSVAEDADLPKMSTVKLLDYEGTVLVRQPDPDNWVGSSESDSLLFDAIRNAGGEGTVETAGLDGTRRLYGFTTLGASPGQQAYIAVGIPAATAYADVDRALTTNLVGLAIIAAFALAVTWMGSDRLLRRPLAELSSAASLVGKGDLSARTGVPHDQSELGNLAQSFDRMAEALEQQHGERDEFERALRASEAQYRHLFTEMHSALALHEMIYNEAGEPQDYRFVEVNPAFEELIGLSAGSIEGRTARELSLGFDEAWLQRYEKVVSTGESARYEDYLEKLDKHLEVSAFRPRPGHFAALMTDITTRKQAEARVHRQLQRLRALRAIDLAIASSLDPRVTFDVLLDQVTHQLEVDAASLLVFDRHMRTLTFRAGRGFRTDALRHTRLKLGEGQAGQAALKREIVRLPDLQASLDGFSRSPMLEDENFISYYAAPLEAKGRIMGVLEIFHREPLTPDQDWFDFLEALAGQGAIAIENSELFNEVQISNQELIQAYDTTLEGWARALELRDDETEGHSARVTEVTVRLARSMGVSDSELVNIRRGSLLHDIGKMGIPDRILLKPGPLTDEEWEIMRRHPVYAYELLAPINFLRPAIAIPYCHHEKWDGTGYPRGLSGNRIPLPARIFAVVDVWDALRSDRPYREAWEEDRVREYIRDQSGEHFDPEAVDAFLQLDLELPEAIAFD